MTINAAFKSEEVNSVPYSVNPKGKADSKKAPIDMPKQGRYNK